MGAILEVLRACEAASDNFGYAGGQSHLKLSQGVSIDLEHSVSMVRGAMSEPVAIVVEEGAVSLCDVATGRKRNVPTGGAKLISAAPHPWLPLMALVDGAAGGLRVQGYDGDTIFEASAPQPSGKGNPPVAPGFSDCFFDDHGTYLWCVANTSDNEVEVQLREPYGWSVVADFAVEDRYGGNHSLFFRTARSDALLLWLPGGENGSCSYWLRLEGQAIRCVEEPGLEGALPPAFSPGGGEFMAVNWQGGVQRFSYPDVRPTGVCSWLPDDDKALDYCPPCYLDERLVLVMSRKHRIFLVDSFAMHVLRELIIEGHEPWPAEWRRVHTMAGDSGLCTDIVSFDRVGDYIVFNHASSGAAPDLSDGPSRLLCFPISAI
jgi:hypothetical protein